MRIDRSGESFGAIALPPRPHNPFWLTLAKLAPRAVAASTAFSWATTWCFGCLGEPRTQSFFALDPTYGEYPRVAPWGWGLLVSALVTLWSLRYPAGGYRAGVRATGLAVGALSLLIPLSVVTGVFPHSAQFFEVRAAVGLWLALGAYTVLAISSLRA